MIILSNLTDVPVWKVTPRLVNASITEGNLNYAAFNLKVDINGAVSASVRGQGLWKVGAWASHRPNGKGERIGYTEQVKEFTTILGFY